MLYRFQIEFSDIERGIYESLDIRTVQHPSETSPYLLTRVLAYALSYQPNLEFTPAGLGDPDAPALVAKGVHGTIELWIDIGNPSGRRMHKASKVSKKVVIYTYKNPEIILEEIKNNDVHRGDEIEIFSFSGDLLKSLEKLLVKNNNWTILSQLGNINVTIGDQSFVSDVKLFKYKM